MLDLKEERKYEQLRKLGQELHTPIPETFWRLEVFDKDGKVIQTLKQRSHSWVRNAYNMLFSTLASVNGDDGAWGGGNLNIKDTTGTVKAGAEAIRQGSGSMKTAGKGYTGGAGLTTNGIVVGSGTDAESFEGYVLQTLITNGSGAGQLAYALSDEYTKSYVAGTKTLTATLVRYMNNNSGGNVSVNEVGLLIYAYGGTWYGPWLTCRDKLVATVTIPNSGQLKVTYEISLVYPA